MKREFKLFINDIIESINAIEEFSKGMNEEGLNLSRLKQSAIIREIEIIGEAVKNIPFSVKEKYPDVPWKKISGSRDILTHGYFLVDMHLVWRIIQGDLPELKKKMLRILRDLEKGE